MMIQTYPLDKFCHLSHFLRTAITNAINIIIGTQNTMIAKAANDSMDYLSVLQLRQ